MNMTREKAIKILRMNEQAKWRSGITVEEEKEAVDMAIEALTENESLAKSVIEASELLRKKRQHGEWIPCSERLPEENICDDGYVEPSDYVLVFGDHGQYGVSRYWGNRRTKKTNPHSFSDWMDLEWFSQKPIAWMPLPKPYAEEGDPNG